MSFEDVNFCKTFPFELWLFGQAMNERGDGSENHKW